MCKINKYRGLSVILTKKMYIMDRYMYMQFFRLSSRHIND